MVTVEVSITGGGLGLYMVGLPDNAVKESEQRVRSAFDNSGYKMTARKCVVNLAPADLRKEGSGFDLPIAVAILAATEQLAAASLEGAVFVGELSLDGSIRGVKGVLPVVAEARAQANEEREQIIREGRQQVVALAVTISERLLRGELQQKESQIVLADRLLDEINKASQAKPQNNEA
jgi:predicted ATPase with chaperone activity